jgi:hypothetical protein
MNIGFYGHSSCAHRGDTSFLDIIANKLNSNIVNVGKRMGSEERSLLDLKQTNPNIAIVFHSQSRLIFAPNRKFDFDASSDWGLEEHEKQIRQFYNRDLRHAELERIRLYGAAMQIEQFCKDKNIFLINCVDKKHPFPDWLKLTNVDHISMLLAKKYSCPFETHFNGITKEGNKLIADNLLKIIR